MDDAEIMARNRERRATIKKWLKEMEQPRSQIVVESNSVDTTMRTMIESIQMAITLDKPEIGDENRSVKDAAESRPGLPIRFRVQPQLYFQLQNKRYRTGAFLSWKHVYWNLTCDGVEEAIAVKNALHSFFAALGAVSPGEVQFMLDTLVKLRVESPSVQRTAAAASNNVGSVT
jgi:DNA gyrase/topoisomerase IV subunit A